MAARKPSTPSPAPSAPKPDRLIVHVKAARNLLDMDIGGTSDPYALVGLRDRGTRHKTATIMKNLNPVWNEQFEFTLENPEFDCLDITVMDYDHMRKDDFIGRLVLPVVTLRPHKEEHTQWYELKDKNLSSRPDKRGKKRGEIQLTLQYIAPNAPEGKQESLTPKWEIPYKELVFGKELGRGAFGVVFRGKWRLQDVAIKQLLDALTAKELEEFRYEASLMQTLRPHKNVVQFLGLCTEPGHPLCIITEFCNGGSLYAYLIKNPVQFPLPWQTVYKLLKGITAGMYHLHAENILHRDLAARNILTDSSWEPRVADFGLSKKVEPLDLTEQNRSLSTSESNTFRGPYKYMAPESLQNWEFSIKTDVWSFGVLTWEIVTRMVEPFPEFDIYQAAFAIVNHKLRLPIPPNIPPVFARLMTWCWMEDPEQRPDFSQISVLLDSIAEEVVHY